MIGFSFGSQSEWNLIYIYEAVAVALVGAVLFFLIRWIGKRLKFNTSTLYWINAVLIAVIVLICLVLISMPIQYCLNNKC